jgi:uncharacterized protein
MRIGIIGATGKAGQDVYREAVDRGAEAVALVRDAAKAQAVLGTGVDVVEKDAFELTAEDLTGFDAVVNAFGTAPEDAHRHLDLSRRLVEAAPSSAEDSPRLVFILGAGSLTNPATGELAIEDIRKVPGAEAWINIPAQQLRQLDYLRTVDSADWVGVSPQMMFAPGPATAPRLGRDEVMTAADGESRTSTGTMAVAILDELQAPAHLNTRFTVSDA